MVNISGSGNTPLVPTVRTPPIHSTEEDQVEPSTIKKEFGVMLENLTQVLATSITMFVSTKDNPSIISQDMASGDLIGLFDVGFDLIAGSIAIPLTGLVVSLGFVAYAAITIIKHMVKAPVDLIQYIIKTIREGRDVKPETESHIELVESPKELNEPLTLQNNIPKTPEEVNVDLGIVQPDLLTLQESNDLATIKPKNDLPPTQQKKSPVVLLPPARAKKDLPPTPTDLGTTVQKVHIATNPEIKQKIILKEFQRTSKEYEFNSGDVQGTPKIKEKINSEDIPEANKKKAIISDKSAKINVNVSDSKKYSTRTQMARNKLEEVLKIENKEFVETVDNGDCFFDAFAQGLNNLIKKGQEIKNLKSAVTVSDLRDLVLELAQNSDNKKWIQDSFQNGYGEVDTYESYLQNIAKHDSQIPIWGKESRDGVLLCNYFGVNLNVYEVLFMDQEIPEGLKKEERSDFINKSYLDAKNYVSGEVSYAKSKNFDVTIDIGLYPGHFVGVVSKDSDKI